MAHHLRIGQGAGNAALLRQMEMLHDKATLVRAMEGSRPHWAGRVVAEHCRILDAMRRREADIAAAEMRYHIRSVVMLRPRQAPLPSPEDGPEASPEGTLQASGAVHPGLPLAFPRPSLLTPAYPPRPPRPVAFSIPRAYPCSRWGWGSPETARMG